MAITNGVSTAYTRDQLDIEKNCVNDAACLGLPDRVSNLGMPTKVLNRQRRHKRQSVNCDKNGSPRAKDAFRKYSKLPRERQGYTKPPSHSAGPRRLRGIASSDIALIHHISGNRHIGRATLDLNKGSVKLKGQGSNGGALTPTASKAALVAHAGRWSVSQRNP